MMKRRWTMLAVLALCLLAPGRGGAQVDLSVGCSPGIPGCGSLRFFIGAVGTPLSLNSVFLQLLSPAWSFASGPSPTSGTYSAQDSWSPFGGFTTLSADRTALSIDFTENGFPFEVFADEVGTLDLEVFGGTDATGLAFRFEGRTSDGGIVSVVTPEPASMILLGSGLAGLAALRRRRKTAART